MADDGNGSAGEASASPADDQSPADGSQHAESDTSPTDEEIVETAAEAAEGLIFSRLSNSDVRDFDVTVDFEDGVLDVDVYLNAPDAAEERVAEDAALAARSAVDDLFAETGN